MSGTLDAGADRAAHHAVRARRTPAGVSPAGSADAILTLGTIQFGVREGEVMAWSGRLTLAPPTLPDVAERAGVSRQTVSNAVNNPDLLRSDTLERVLEAIGELGYLPNRAARNLRTRASHLVGMRIGPAQEGTANATMDRFVHSLVDTSREAGYHVLLFAGTDSSTNPLAGY